MKYYRINLKGTEKTKVFKGLKPVLNELIENKLYWGITDICAYSLSKMAKKPFLGQLNMFLKIYSTEIIVTVDDNLEV